jgi:hypothetical protein
MMQATIFLANLKTKLNYKMSDMISPFKMRFKEVVNLKIPVDTMTLIDLIKENLIKETNGIAVGFQRNGSSLSFSTNFFNGGWALNLKTIDKGVFKTNIENNKANLVFTYYLGRKFIYFAGMCLLFFFASRRPAPTSASL